MLYQSIMFSNGKGGVGTTSICANVAGVASHSGWRTLVIDLDPQGNLGSDLGYRQQGLSDEGEGLLDAVASGAALRPLRNVRPNLDAIPAGSATKDLLEELTNRHFMDPRSVLDLVRVLEPLEDLYDLVLIDSPPTGGIAVDAALAACHWLVIPVRLNDGSTAGLDLTVNRSAAIRSSVNPDLQLLGVALFDSPARGTVARTEVRRRVVEELGGAAPVFKSIVGRADRAAYDMRRGGVLAHEHAQRAEAAKSRVSIAERIKRTQRISSIGRDSVAASELAQDYKKLATEILLSLGDVAHGVRPRARR